MSDKLKVMITGGRYRCSCCDRIALIIKKSDGPHIDDFGYFYEFESELGQLRWISAKNASIRFHRIGDSKEKVKETLQSAVKER